VIARKRTEEEVLREFLDTFDSDGDGKVSPKEFIKYYGNVSSSIDDDDYFELMIRNAWHISGGEGWCANSSCRRVLVRHADLHESVEEIKNDIGIQGDDKAAMLANLVGQGITDIIAIELNGQFQDVTPATPGAVAPTLSSPSPKNKVTPPEPPSPVGNVAAGSRRVDPDVSRPSTAPSPGNPRRHVGGQSSIIFG